LIAVEFRIVEMLPAWATVALALGGSALTALAALIAVSIEARRGRDEQWRRMVFDVAIGFSESAMTVEAALLAVCGRAFDRLKGDAPLLQFPPDATAKVSHLDELRNNLYIAWDKVGLVLGIESAAAIAAETTIDEARRAITAIEHGDVLAYLQALTSLDSAERAYLAAANEAMKAPGRVARRRRASAKNAEKSTA
jgi:hypothetical protein